MEAVRVRDWLAKLHGAGGAEDIDKFQEIVAAMAEVRPELEGEACRIAGEYFEGGEIWTAELCSKAMAKGLEAAQPWKAKLAHIEDWEQWKPALVELVKAGEVEEDVAAAEAERWGEGGGEEFLALFISPEMQRSAEKPDNATRLAEVMAGYKLDREQVKKIAAELPEPDPDDEIDVEGETVIDDQDFDDTIVEVVPITPGEILLPVSAAAAEQVQLLNQKHAVVGNYGSKCAVLAWERWNVNQKVMVPVFQTLTDFRNRYMNRYVERETDEGVKRVAAGKFWLSHPKRVTYDAVAFEPGQPQVLPGNRLNLWRDFAVKPKKGSWKRLRNHIYRVLGSGDRKAGRYIMRWLAWTLQNPGKPAEAVLVFQGDEGAGKGTLARALLKIFGPNGLPISDAKLLVGSFSGHLHYCVFMFVDEAFWAGDVGAEGRLKALITEEEITIEPKYFTAFPIPNKLHIMMSSNNDWVVPAGRNARRYAVFKVSSERIGDFKYFDELNAELDNGGIQAMLHDLLRLDLGGWHPKMIYKTAALMDQKLRSLRGLDAWVETILQAGCLPEPCSSKYPNRCLSKDLLAAAKGFDRYTNDSLVARKLQQVLDVTEFNNRLNRGWVFPELSECRRLWELRNGGHWHWDHNITQWRFEERDVHRR